MAIYNYNPCRGKYADIRKVMRGYRFFYKWKMGLTKG